MSLEEESSKQEPKCPVTKSESTPREESYLND